MAFDAVIRDIFCDNLLHTLFDTRHIFQCNRATDPQITEITFGDRVFHKQLPFGKKLTDSLEQDKAE
jgi:hypothetical protein